MRCSKCGGDFTDDAMFCPECGERVIRSEPILQAEQQTILSNEEGPKIEISYSIDSRKMSRYLAWISRALDILACAACVCLALDFGKIREENIGLLLLSKEERLENYFMLFLKFELSSWTKIFLIIFFLSIVIATILGLFIKKRGGLPDLGREKEMISYEINNMFAASCAWISALVWIWVLI